MMNAVLLDPRSALLEAMRESGWQPAEELHIEPNGELVRFQVSGDKPGSKNGWAVLHPDHGAAGSWRSEERVTWAATGAKKAAAGAIFKQRIEAKAAEQQRRDAGHAQAAERARSLWEKSAPCADHPYLQRKKVNVDGLRVAPDGWLLVPLRDAAGVLWNCQRIAPNKPADGTSDKLFLRGARKAGLWHLLGQAVDGQPILIAEGLSTAATLHMATQRPCAVAFGAGNLKSIALALRAAYPTSLLVLCGDDDHHDAPQQNQPKGSQSGA